jgi:hypothetical protein
MQVVDRRSDDLDFVRMFLDGSHLPPIRCFTQMRSLTIWLSTISSSEVLKQTSDEGRRWQIEVRLFEVWISQMMGHEGITHCNRPVTLWRSGFWGFFSFRSFCPKVVWGSKIHLRNLLKFLLISVKDFNLWPPSSGIRMAKLTPPIEAVWMCPFETMDFRQDPISPSNCRMDADFYIWFILWRLGTYDG